jgi:aspartate/methionine/tyrosine aminotransferase
MLLAPKKEVADIQLSIRSIQSSKAGNYGPDFKQMLNEGNTTPWSPTTAKRGRINLSIAENRLNFLPLQAKLAEHSIDTCTVEISQYGPAAGLPRLRSALAKHLSHLLGGVKESLDSQEEQTEQKPCYTVNPNHLVMTEGVTSAIDALAFTLSNPNDAWLTPVPFYVSYRRDLKTRSGVDIWPVRRQNSDAPLESMPSIADFEAAWNQCQRKNKKVTAVLLCNPHNPTGCFYSEDELITTLSWCDEKNVHVVVDEIFAATIYGKDEKKTFTSVLSLAPSLGPRITVLWGCAKEFGLGGWHLGCILSESDRLREALTRIINISGIPSSPIQNQLAGVLEDRTFIHEYSRINKEILAECSREVVTECRRLNFSFIKPLAGLFVLVDLSRLMKESTYANERALFRHIFYECNVVMTPGEGSMAPPGMFRCCFACAPKGAVVEAFKRIEKLTKEDITMTQEDIDGADAMERRLDFFFGDGSSETKM